MTYYDVVSTIHQSLFFGAVFSCGPGYQEVTNATDSTVSCAPCGAGTYNTADTFAQASCFGCRTGQAQPLTGQTACLWWGPAVRHAVCPLYTPYMPLATLITVLSALVA